MIIINRLDLPRERGVHQVTLDRDSSWDGTTWGPS